MRHNLLNNLKNPIFCALDTSSLEEAVYLSRNLYNYIGGLKLGLQFFYSHGIEGVKEIAKSGLPMFFDLKLHDIPNTVAGGIKSLLPLEPDIINIHISGGRNMLEAARNAIDSHSGEKPMLIGVSIMTSLGINDTTEVGYSDSPITKTTIKMANIAKDCGLDGIVCSTEDLPGIRQATDNDFVTIVPGIRPKASQTNDQKRIATPRKALDSGANILVIGRPITAASNPVESAKNIINEL